VSRSLVEVVVLWDMTPVGLYSITLRMETTGVYPKNTCPCPLSQWSCKQMCNELILTCSMFSADKDRNS